MYFDWTYLIFILPAAAFAMIASSKVQSTYATYAKQYVRNGLTAQAAARKMLDQNGLYHVKIERIQGQLTDHYDPRSKIIRLSEAVYDKTSTAAIGVACHEVGHAIQDAQNYAPLRLRNAIIPLTNLGSMLSWPMIMFGLLFQADTTPIIAYLGIGLFGFAVLFQVFTLPTEFDASKRAIISLSESGTLSKEELYGAKKVLDAAALTYVAALASAVMQMLRLIVIVLSNTRRRDD